MNKSIYLWAESCFLLFIRPDWKQLVSGMLTKRYSLCPPLVCCGHVMGCGYVNSWDVSRLSCFLQRKSKPSVLFWCFYYACTKDSETAFVLRLKQMYTGCHINFFCKGTQFSCSQNTGGNSDCIVPKKRWRRRICSFVTSRLVTSVVPLFLNSLGCGAGLIVQCCWCFWERMVSVKCNYTPG